MHTRKNKVHSRWNELTGVVNGFHYCTCGANAIIEPDEIMCVVCRLNGVKWLEELKKEYGQI